LGVKLAIVIIHYNSSGDLDRCLESLVAHAPDSRYGRCPVVIVDNDSRDGGLADVHRRYPDFQWIFNTENVGYARAGNQGMALIEAEYYLILNPDIVVQSGALDRLLEFGDANPRAGMVGPQLLNEDGSIQESCRRFYTMRTLLLRRTFLGKIFPDSETVRLHLMRDFDHRSVRPVDWVLGGCMLVRAEAMDRTGPMDERFFLYFEDVDWCYRMWQAGREVLYTPDARFIHRHRRQSAEKKFSRTFWLHLTSLISFYEKWGMLVWLLKKWRGPLLVFLLWAMDMLGLGAAFGMSYGLRSMMGQFFTEPLYPFAEYLPLILFASLLASLTFLSTGRYRPESLRRPKSITATLQRNGTVALLLLASTYLGHQEVVSRVVLLGFVVFLGMFSLLGEDLLRKLLARLERGNLSLERTLLVGGPGEIQSWLDGTGDMIHQGVDIAGYVSDPESEAAGLPALGGGNVPWLGSHEELLAVVTRYRISQVVFWQRPIQGSSIFNVLARLRRLRVRLRWQVEDVWLLQARARAEVFGDAPSAVQDCGNFSILTALISRLGALGLGLVLGVVGFLPWVGLQILGKPRGWVMEHILATKNLWGHDPEVKVMAAKNGKVLPLIWQYPLVGSLLGGRMAVWGGRAVTGISGQELLDASSARKFWLLKPDLPGLTGPWARNEQTPMAPLMRLWVDPGGFEIPESVSVEGNEKKMPFSDEALD
jgi:GT2 family glycosyltransferase